MKLKFAHIRPAGFSKHPAAIKSILSLMAIFLISWVVAGFAWSSPDNKDASSITIQARKGNLEVIDQYGSSYQLEDGADATFYGIGPEVIRITGQLQGEDTASVSVVAKEGPTVEDPSLFVGAAWFRDISFTGIDKNVIVCDQNTSVSLMANTRNAPSESRPEVGDVFSGKCSVSAVHEDSYGTINAATCVINTGILKEIGSVVAYCADHTAAAPYVGQQFTYTFTITSVNKKTGKVVGSMYAVPVSGATDGVTTDSSGHLTGYQRLSVKVELTRSYSGYIRLKKVSTIPSMTSSNSQYSLDGATYRIYEDKSCKNRSDCDDIVTKEGSYVKSEAIAAGTYYVKEIKAPKGFELSDKVYKVEVDPDETVDVGVAIDGKTVISEMPRRNPSKFILGKLDKDSNEGCAQGDASLQGAQYKVEYYDGQYTSVDSAENSGDPKRQWTFSSDANGKIDMCNESYLVNGALYKDANGEIVFPLGSYIIYEVKAPIGYLLSNEKSIVRILKDPDSDATIFNGNVIKGSTISGATSVYSEYANVVPIKEPPIKGSLKVEKRDLETLELQPLGNATLEGTQFKVTNRSKAKVYVDDIACQPGEICATFYTNKEGIGALLQNSLPYGTYSVQEVAPSKGYLLTDKEERTFQIRQEGEIAFYGKEDEEDTSKKGDAFYNQVIREDLAFVKVRGDTAERLSNIPFEIVSKTTGERHVVITDENGEIRTEASWNPHTENTNANDSFDEDSIIRYAGVWWGVTANGTTAPPRDDLCALVFDDYELKELSTSKNQGLELVSFEFSATRNNHTINLGTIENNPPELVQKPSITTTASDASDGDKHAYASSKCKLMDQVSYMNLTPNTTYTLHATLLDAETLQLIPKAETYHEFKPEATFGSVTVELECDTLAVAGHDVVFFEELALDNEVICEHKDADDVAQKISIAKPEVETYAQDSHDGDKNIVADIDSKVTDNVKLKNLEPNISYTLYGIVMDSDTVLPAIVKNDTKTAPTESEMEAFWSGLVDLLGAELHINEDGSSYDIEYNNMIDKATLMQYVEANPNITNSIDIVSKEIVPKSDIMTTSLDYSVSSDALNGEYVIFDLLLNDEAVVAVHADTSNADQSFEIIQPTITTTATDKTDGDHNILPSTEAKITDLVEYSGLVSGAQYEITGTLMNKDDGKALYVNDKLVEATAKFTPNAESGSVEVNFTFDASGIPENSNLVAYECLRKDGRQIAEHADINSESQTVQVSTMKYGSTPQKSPLPGDSYYKTGFTSKRSSLATLLLMSAILFSLVAFKFRRRRMV